MAVETLIAGGTVVTGDAMFEAAVAIDDGTIVGVGEEKALPAADHRIDASGLLVMPGIVDPHVHLAGYNTLDTYESGTAAAAAGGVTTLVNFAWQGWRPEAGEFEAGGTLTDAVERHRDRADEALIDVGFHPVVTREDPSVFEELPELVAAGITSFKIFTTDSIRLSHGFIGELFEHLSEHGAVGMAHTEDHAVCTSKTEQLRDSPDPTVYPDSRPDYAEAMAADTLVRLAVEADAKYYGVHTTSEAAVDAIETHRTDGSNVRAETCTHYTVFDRSVYDQLGNTAIMSPPLRAAGDVDAMYDGIRDGTLSVVSSDHVATTEARKRGDAWWDCHKGVNSLQTGLPVFHDEAVNKRGLSYPELVQLKCRRPARTFGMPNKGRIQPGADADIVLFDTDETYTITAEDNLSKADFSIYQDRTVTGRVEKTFVRGELVADGGEIIADSGYGNVLSREVPDWS
ncbi:dihydroorotase [Haloarcula laminariae]|uniref:dihydroorotase n=1 Tax=Haloarcula laminariae TaxID=2961577 RepID=UPI0021C5E942|nr:amidohydrolase family protein [Halomicroarcula laminariae]